MYTGKRTQGVCRLRSMTITLPPSSKLLVPRRCMPPPSYRSSSPIVYHRRFFTHVIYGDFAHRHLTKWLNIRVLRGIRLQVSCAVGLALLGIARQQPLATPLRQMHVVTTWWPMLSPENRLFTAWPSHVPGHPITLVCPLWTWPHTTTRLPWRISLTKDAGKILLGSTQHYPDQTHRFVLVTGS